MRFMDRLWLIKIGEIGLKKGNRAFFERVLKENIRRRLQDAAAEPADAPAPSGIPAGKPPKARVGTITIRSGRVYLKTPLDDEPVARTLSTTPGIVAFCKARRVEKTLEALGKASREAALQCLADGRGGRFKFEVRRTDKGLPLDSYGYARKLGNMMLKTVPGLTVDVRNPDFIIKVELREWGYVYQREQPGAGGLPVGSTGRGMLLLSGGIDSPVAGFMMAKRGMRLTAVHFHTPHYTPPEAHDKVLRLGALLAPWCGGLTIFSVPFTECQVKINQSVDAAATTLHSRACMTQIAEILAAKRRCAALVTGEVLGQVASQTLESLAYTDSATSVPVFRPLTGLDKGEIITISRKIGTFETAIEPFDDCCTLFGPSHPLTRPDTAEQQGIYEGIEDLPRLMDKAAAEAQVTRFDSAGRKMN